MTLTSVQMRVLKCVFHRGVASPKEIHNALELPIAQVYKILYELSDIPYGKRKSEPLNLLVYRNIMPKSRCAKQATLTWEGERTVGRG